MSGVNDSIRHAIACELNSLEAQHRIRILYACESGSRAWGSESADSDYDVRLVFVHSPQSYLGIDEPRDVVELPAGGELDISGWELRKALRLFRKSNPALLEWLQSPVVYLERFSTAKRLRELVGTCFSPTACLHHYLSMARGNYRAYLLEDEVRTKKYLYALRPILACLWIERLGAPPPMEFEKLVRPQYLDSGLVGEIVSLLDKKRAGCELATGPRFSRINQFLETEIARLETCVSSAATGSGQAATAALNELFRDTLREVWGVSEGWHETL